MSNPQTATSLEQRAIDFARRGDFGVEARSVNEELTRLSPTNEGAWTRLARCCLELGQLDEAASALDAALQVNPANTIARNLHVEVSRRRSGAPEPAAPRRRARITARGEGPPRARAQARPGARGSSAHVAGIGGAEFTTLSHLPPALAAESLGGRLDPLLMALNERPFAARVVEARNRAAQAGTRLFRRGSVHAGPPGHIYVCQQGGRWEPQLTLGLYARSQFGRDALAAGLAFDATPGGDDERAGAGRERALRYFEAFQREVASTWRVHLTEWMRANGGFLQRGRGAPETDRLPADALTELNTSPPLQDGRTVLARWLFADRAEDVGLMTDGPRLLRWLEGTFTDLLPLWSTVYRAVR